MTKLLNSHDKITRIPFVLRTLEIHIFPNLNITVLVLEIVCLPKIKFRISI